MPASKHCPGCRRTRPIGSFHRKAEAPDGYQDRCKDCYNLYRRERYAKSKNPPGEAALLSDDEFWGRVQLTAEMRRGRTL